MSYEQTDAKQRQRKYRERKRHEIAERRAAVSERYRKGWTIEEIARDIGSTRSTVGEDIQAMIAEWGRTAGINISAHIAIELERINQLEGEARRAYETSKQPKRVASARRMITPVENEDGTPVETEDGKPLTVETSAASATEYYRPEGDPRFLTVIIQCIGQRMRLLGLNGMPDEAAEKKNKATTFSDFVAAHLDGENKATTMEDFVAAHWATKRAQPLPTDNKARLTPRAEASKPLPLP